MNKYTIISASVVCVVILLSLCTWSPWVSELYAEEKAEEAFIRAWEQVSDGCGLDCEDCGIKGTRKVLFGRLVRIDYVCGWEGDVITNKSEDIFVPFMGNAQYSRSRS